MNIPDQLRYTTEHEWVLLEGNVATVGITEFAQSELGELVFVDLPKSGKEFKQGDIFCVVESTKAASDVYAPIGGKVKEGNSELSNSPTLVNTDPYGKGWIAKIENPNQADLAKLMSAADYRKIVEGKH